jgi:hypothetical protein
VSEDLDLDCFSDDDLKRIIKFTEIRKNRVMFATTHHRNTKGEHLEFNKFYHMKELYETLARKICIMGGAQIGKTDWLVIDSLALAHSGLNAFFVLPKFDMRASFVQEKVQRPLNLSPEYKLILKDSTFSRIEQMQFGRGIIKYVGSSVEADFVSYSADAYYIEEMDKCDSVENIELGFSRMDQSIYKIERFVSNPTTKQGLIYKRYDLSDKRKWMCPCDNCNEFSDLDFFKSVVDEVTDNEGNIINYVLRDDSWKRGCGRDIRIICPKCGSGVLDRNSPERFWFPTEQSERKITGYHMPSLISPTVAVSELWQEYRDALEDPSKMTRFYSMRLAVPYAATGNKISDAVLENCIDKDYRLEIHPGYACVVGNKHSGPCSMGIDTSPNHIDVRISSYDRGKRRMVYVGKFDATKSYLLHDLVSQYNVQVAVMDIGPEKLMAEEFRDTAKCVVWLCKYLGAGDGRFKSLNDREMIISIDRTEALDRGYSQLKTGKNILPVNYKDLLSGVYAQEMCELIREVEEDKKGNVKYSWVGSAHNHHRHCDAYDLLAFEMLSEDVLIGTDCIYVG